MTETILFNGRIRTMDGVVEPVFAVEVSPRVDGIIETVALRGGERVEEGVVLFAIDDDAFRIAIEAARAALEEARARRALAEDAAVRQAERLARETGSRVAELDPSRTRVTAPIAGCIGRPRVASGAFVEAEAGATLAQILQEDRALVACAVSFEDRLAALAGTGTAEAFAMYDPLTRTLILTLALVLPGGIAYPHGGVTRFESARIDRATGTLTTLAAFPDPNGVLVPGLPGTVRSEIAPAEGAAR
jgi:membrane fusion protein (multidrug efflux system)